MKYRFQLNYFLLAILLFIAEIFIGAYMSDSIKRPYGGDFLIVIFLYCLLRSFANIKVLPATIGVLLFAYLI